MARILVIDDDVGGAELAATLTSAGHQVLKANDAELVLALIKSQSPDLALVEVALPNGAQAGFGLLKRIKAHNPAIAVIITSVAAASRQRVVLALRGGAQDFIEKPFRAQEVRQRVGAALAQQQTAWAY